jgi:hypothetical protein
MEITTQFFSGFSHFPQDKESFGSVTSHEENAFAFSRSLRVFGSL